MSSHKPRSLRPSFRGRRRRRRERRGPGSPPGEIVVDPEAPACVIQTLAFGPEGKVDERVGATLQEIASLRGQWPTLWVNVDGQGDEATLEGLAALFDLHPLALEDVVHAGQRPKVDTYGDELFVALRMPHFNGSGTDPLTSEQISIFVTADVVLTFQEHPDGDCFDGVRERIRRGRLRIRKNGAGYLAYALVDAVVDAYFPILDGCEERIFTLEAEALGRPAADFVSRLFAVRHDLLALLRMVRPLRELTQSLSREERSLIDSETRIYLRDCHDHARQIIDAAESYREFGEGLLDVHLSLVGHRMNETMKVLTIMASIFIPLNFVAGVYGMNFAHMPELEEPWAYPAVLLLMVVVALGLLVFFRRKGWVGDGGSGLPRERENSGANGERRNDD